MQHPTNKTDTQQTRQTPNKQDRHPTDKTDPNKLDRHPRDKTGTQQNRHTPERQDRNPTDKTDTQQIQTHDRQDRHPTDQTDTQQTRQTPQQTKLDHFFSRKCSGWVIVISGVPDPPSVRFLDAAHAVSYTHLTLPTKA